MNDRNQLYLDDKQERCHFYMRKGYIEMAEINLNLAQMCLIIESEVEDYIQQKIAECE
ncbi:MAG: hypothetical protein ACLFMO_04375 [Eubacteriales bacterium]